jgi:hypothetical protein
MAMNWNFLTHYAKANGILKIRSNSHCIKMALGLITTWDGIHTDIQVCFKKA